MSGALHEMNMTMLHMLHLIFHLNVTYYLIAVLSSVFIALLYFKHSMVVH